MCPCAYTNEQLAFDKGGALPVLVLTLACATIRRPCHADELSISGFSRHHPQVVVHHSRSCGSVCYLETAPNDPSCIVDVRSDSWSGGFTSNMARPWPSPSAFSPPPSLPTSVVVERLGSHPCLHQTYPVDLDGDQGADRDYHLAAIGRLWVPRKVVLPFQVILVRASPPISNQTLVHYPTSARPISPDSKPRRQPTHFPSSSLR
ncbi:hypothetical protein F4809DRAFT_243009 [Biscogniauxia mediterranea]|nr:hypothetical protein F4809DRAFT_243009 [Biscogniauxia mediterranea]